MCQKPEFDYSFCLTGAKRPEAAILARLIAAQLKIEKIIFF